MKFLSLDIYHGRYAEFLETIKTPEKKTLVFTPNPEILLRASKDREFLDILKQADYLTPDANGLYTASLIQEGSGYISALFQTFVRQRRLREKYGERISGSTLTHDLIEYATREKKKILMIDNYRIKTAKNDFEKRKMEIQGKFHELFREKFPDLDIEVVFDGEKTPEELAKLIEKENISYVFSCIGMKSQEARLIEIFDTLPEATKVVGLGVGSSFDYLLGLQKRAPLFLQSLGLEWLYRLVLDPRARWGRIMDAIWRFPMMIQAEKKRQNLD